MVEEKKVKGAKPMKLPRFSYQVPEDLTSMFLQEMKDDFRETASELVTSILRRHFQQKLEKEMLRGFTGSPQEDRIPEYGPKSETLNADQTTTRNLGEE